MTHRGDMPEIDWGPSELIGFCLPILAEARQTLYGRSLDEIGEEAERECPESPIAFKCGVLEGNLMVASHLLGRLWERLCELERKLIQTPEEETYAIEE